MEITDIAAICHEANAALCRAGGDMTQPPWAVAPEWQKESAIDGVRFHIANPNVAPAASHENWLRVKEADGWVYGLVKNQEKKEHPCMMPFYNLPPEQQAKDYLFTSIVRALAPFLRPAR